MDEGPLLAMLRGQTRETFRLGFSLDQTRLREGGEAIVKAKDDLGRAVFCCRVRAYRRQRFARRAE